MMCCNSHSFQFIHGQDFHTYYQHEGCWRRTEPPRVIEGASDLLQIPQFGMHVLQVFVYFTKTSLSLVDLGPLHPKCFLSGEWRFADHCHWILNSKLFVHVWYSLQQIPFLLCFPIPCHSLSPTSCCSTVIVSAEETAHTFSCCGCVDTVVLLSFIRGMSALVVVFHCWSRYANGLRDHLKFPVFFQDMRCSKGFAECLDILVRCKFFASFTQLIRQCVMESYCLLMLCFPLLTVARALVLGVKPAKPSSPSL